MTILIVDDEPLILQGILNGVDWAQLQYKKVLTAKNCVQAREYLEQMPIEVLLTDVEIGDENGLDLIQWVNANHPEIKSIVLSCHDEFVFAQRAVRLECFDYILKPITYENLTQVLYRVQRRVLQEQNQLLMERYGKAYVQNMKDTPPERSTEDVLETVKQYVQQHIGEDMSVEILAKEAHVSSRHLNRLFQKYLGTTVSDYITNQRMLLAGQLLRTTQMSVTWISDRVGYSNYSYFIKQFKKFHGMTPGEYQKKPKE